MTQLVAGKSTPQIKGDNHYMARFPIYDAEKMWSGGMIAVDYTDEAHMASNTQGLKVIGRCPKNVDNTLDGEYILDSDSRDSVRGIFRYGNSATYPVPRSAIGQLCFVEDDNIVAAYASAFISAGLVYDVDSDGVWVDQRPAAMAMAEMQRPWIKTVVTDSATITAAIAFDGITFYNIDKATLATLTLPSAVAGMRFGVQRATATAAHDTSILAATGDTIQASDATCAAGKRVENTVDAISGVLWYRAISDVAWVVDREPPVDFVSWLVNDA